MWRALKCSCGRPHETAGNVPSHGEEALKNPAALQRQKHGTSTIPTIWWNRVQKRDKTRQSGGTGGRHLGDHKSAHPGRGLRGEDQLPDWREHELHESGVALPRGIRSYGGWPDHGSAGLLIMVRRDRHVRLSEQQPVILKRVHHEDESLRDVT
jgi:hypothetical protein